MNNLVPYIGEIVAIATGVVSAGFLASVSSRDLIRIVERFVIRKSGIQTTETELGLPQPSNRGVSERIADYAAPRPRDVVTSNFDLLEGYYRQTLEESKVISRATVAVASLGFIAVLVGGGLAIAGITTVGVVSSVAGLVSEGAAFLFFKQNARQMQQVEDYHKKLVSTQYLLTAVSLAESLSEEVRHQETRRIISNLLFLSNELHGSKSVHLFGTLAVEEAAVAEQKPVQKIT